MTKPADDLISRILRSSIAERSEEIEVWCEAARDYTAVDCRSLLRVVTATPAEAIRDLEWGWWPAIVCDLPENHPARHI